ncbi:DUF6098 family protein [Flindersiella endophytica]
MDDARTGDQLAAVASLQELSVLVAETPGLFVRYSKGPDHDLERTSVDYESGLELPGLSVNRLDAEAWWTRSIRDWLARQLCQYLHLSDRGADHHGWILRGRVVGRGPDDEPLVVDVEPVAYLHDDLLEEAYAWYQQRFDVGRSSA